MSYAIDLGLPPPKPPSAFNRDPEVKTEVIWSGPVPRPAARLVERAGAALRVRDGRGWATVGRVLPPWTSMLTEYADPQAAPEMLTLRDAVRVAVLRPLSLRRAGAGARAAIGQPHARAVWRRPRLCRRAPNHQLDRRRRSALRRRGGCLRRRASSSADQRRRALRGDDAAARHAAPAAHGRAVGWWPPLKTRPRLTPASASSWKNRWAKP